MPRRRVRRGPAGGPDAPCRGRSTARRSPGRWSSWWRSSTTAPATPPGGRWSATNPRPRRGSGLLGPPPGPSPPGVCPRRPTATTSSSSAPGAGGGVAASVLTRAGLRVLLLERGELLAYDEVGNDHLRNFRVSRYGHNTPPYLDGRRPAGGRRPDGTERVEPPWGPGYGALPHTVGGGTRVYQGMAWRLTPEDFRLASTHGVPGRQLAGRLAAGRTPTWSRSTRGSSRRSGCAATAPRTATRAPRSAGVPDAAAAGQHRGPRAAARRRAARADHGAGPAADQLRAAGRPGALRAVRRVRRVRVPERREERAVQHASCRTPSPPAASW